MKNTQYDGYRGIRLPRKVQLERIRHVIEQELSPVQREVLLAYYFQKQTVPQIAAARGVYKSTVSRTLRRAEANLRRYLRY